MFIRNPMRNDWGYADASRTREIICDLRSRPRPFGFEKGMTNLIKLERCHPHTDLSHHLAQSLRTDASDRFEILKVFFRVSGHELIVMQNLLRCHCEERWAWRKE